MHQLAQNNARIGTTQAETVRLKTYHSSKWYIHKTDAVIENGTYTIHWCFEMQTGHPFQIRKPVLVLINK